MKRPHLSPSSIETFCRCPVQWRFRYLDGLIVPPGIAALKGKGLHAGAAHNMQQKIDSHQDLPVSQIVEAAVEGFDASLRDGYTLAAHEEGARDATVGAARDSVVQMALSHASEQAPDYQPVLVEKTIEVLTTGTHNLLGIVDLVDDQDRLVDFKTGGRKKPIGEVDSSVQLTAYSALHHVLTGRLPSEVRLDVLVEGRRGVDRQLLVGTRGPNDIIALENRIKAIELAIDAGVFIPCSPGSWCCSPRWCGFFSQCEFVYSERIAIAESFDA